MSRQTSLFGAASPSGEFSACETHPECSEPFCAGRRYRYLLRWPTGLDNSRIALWVMANPSTATPDELDATLRRTVAYSREWGFGWMHVVNVRAWRETDPDLVPIGDISIGPDNDTWIQRAVSSAELVVCGWGKLGGLRGREVARLIRGAGKVPHALKLNGDSSPQHPLYLASNLLPVPMEGS